MDNKNQTISADVNFYSFGSQGKTVCYDDFGRPR